MVIRTGKAAGLVLVGLLSLGLGACQERSQEPGPQFRPSMATVATPAAPVEKAPARPHLKPVDPDDYEDAKAPPVPIVPGKVICRECDMLRQRKRPGRRVHKAKIPQRTTVKKRSSARKRLPEQAQ